MHFTGCSLAVSEMAASISNTWEQRGVVIDPFSIQSGAFPFLRCKGSSSSGLWLGDSEEKLTSPFSRILRILTINAIIRSPLDRESQRLLRVFYTRSCLQQFGSRRILFYGSSRYSRGECRFLLEEKLITPDYLDSGLVLRLTKLQISKGSQILLHDSRTPPTQCYFL
ncbi:hypothetical protein P3X46_001824 [Hevea brasiliensis]|uniref:Uncharacterized protein n=1 Tax=Hevea brasiliensis TaxID=3981 RepID=A0ABQ9NJW6_HEVBR|nr:hypothetical protein P3X46_001824 [Hevea brasiliensis]